MPKYYRFRATTPTRKTKKARDRERDVEVKKSKFIAERNCFDMTVACSSAPSWYLRRTAWRDNALAGLPRGLPGLRTFLQLSNRPLFLLKIPSTILPFDAKFL